MKIHHLLDGVSIIITNEERNFIGAHGQQFPVASLSGRETWLAQNLLRKNVYKLTNDSTCMIINNSK